MDVTQHTFHFCLLIPCYNNEEGLVRSLQSVDYHPGKYLVLIIDDGSPQPINCADLKEKSGKDFPLQVIRLQKNSGIVEALNTGLRWIIDHSRINYIARLDCGDICDNKRFFQQVEYLDANPEIGLLGSWCIFQAADNNTFSYVYRTPTKHEQICRAMHFRNVFIHPTVMFRTSVLTKAGYYPKNFPHVEDYALFWTIVKQTKTVVLDQYLVKCEINPRGISLKHRKAQLRGRYKVVEAFSTSFLLKMLGLIRLKILMFLPYVLVLRLKRRN